MAKLRVVLEIGENGNLLLQSNGPAEAVFELLQRAQAAMYQKLLASATTEAAPEPSRIIPVAAIPAGVRLT